MLDPGEDPGGGPLERPVTRPQPVEDSGPGPRRDESLSAFRRRIVGSLTRIEKEEEKLSALKSEFNKKKLVYAKLFSKKRPALRPELKELEEALKNQKELVRTLKENSGAFKEKYKNEERFSRMRRRAATSMESDPASEEMPVPTESAESEKVGPEDEPNSSTPPQSAEPPMTGASVPLPPQQYGVSEQEVEGGTDMLQFIAKLESPADSSDDEGMETVPCPLRPVKGSLTLKPTTSRRKSDPTISHDTTEETTQQAGTVCVQDGGDDFINNNGLAEGCSAAGSQPTDGVQNATQSESPAEDKLSDSDELGRKSADNCEPLGEEPAERSTMDTAGTLPGPDTVAASENGGGHAGSSGATTVKKSAVSRTVFEPRKKAEWSEQGEGAGLASIDPMAAMVTNSASFAASKDSSAIAGGVTVGKTYAGAAAGSRRGERAGKDPANVSSSLFRRRNVVQFRWEGEGIPPHRRAVVDKILQMGFKPTDIFALISPVGSYEYDLSFIRPESLDIFWDKYEHVCRSRPDWKGLIPRLISRQPLIKMVTILVRNESISQGDLCVWLRRYGEILSPLMKTVDDRGIWTGGVCSIKVESH